MPWKAIACSAKGTSHEKVGSPCQDYAGFIKVNDSGDAVSNGDILIGAVCDGAGSYKYSDIGSELAVKTALKYLQSWLKWLKKEGKDLSPAISEDYAHQVFEKILAKVKEEFDAKAQEMGCYPKDLSCTLLVVVATPQWLAAMQIGDGFIVIRQPDSEYQLLFQPIKGEYANETTFVTASNALEKMRVRVVTGEQQFIFASTDGLERIALEIRQESKPHPPVLDNFREAIKTRSEDEEKISTEKWLQSEAVNERTDDDKTILLCWYESVRVPPQPPTPEPQPSGGVPPKPEPISTFKPPVDVTPKPEPTRAPQPLGGVTSQPKPTPVAQPSENVISQPNSNPETQSSGVGPAVDPAKKEDYSIEVYAFVINVLAGIFWNSLYHDLVVDRMFQSPALRNIIGIILAIILTVLILGVDGYLYRQKIKTSSSAQRKNKLRLFIYMVIIYLGGLFVGGLVYYLIYSALGYFSHVEIKLH